VPKENIDCMVGTGLRAEVAWSPGENGHVQVATICPGSDMTQPGDNEGDPDQLFYGWHATLDREGINRMIRALRKARDSVYGRDE
jgi:hypothetical protein